MNASLQQAWEHYRNAQVDEAEDIAQRVCMSADAGAESHYLLGSCYAIRQKYPEAIAEFNASLAFEPFLAYTHVALAGAHERMGSAQDAEASYRKAIRIAPATGEAHLGLAEILFAGQDMKGAKPHYLKACKLLPRAGLPHYRLGLIARDEGQRGEQVLPYFLNAVQREPGSPEFLSALGQCLLKLQKYEQARNLFDKTLAVAPDDPVALGGMTTVCVKKGEYLKAQDFIDRVLDAGIAGSEVETAFLQVCKHLERCDEAVAYAEECLRTQPLADETAKTLHMQLAATLDHLQRFDEAWEHLAGGKRLQHHERGYDPVMHRVFIDRLIAAFSHAGFLGLPTAEPRNGPQPLFIIGMPRSGTSLTEQILASHPGITGGGELTLLPEMIKTLPADLQSGSGWPGCVDALTGADVQRLADRYLDHLHGLSKTGSYVSDKMPHNYYALGLIRLMFPQAKIIHVRRDAFDTCLSIYFQNFAVGHEYADTLFHLGTHYHQYSRLMQHWRENLPGGMLEVDYERLVSSQEAVTREMLDYCGLPFHADCLQFHAQRREVDTASFDQVRQPINTRSIDKWRNYEQHLDELRHGLERGF